MAEFTARDRLKLLGGATGLLLSACGGSSSSTPTAPVAVAEVTPTPTTTSPKPASELTEGLLRDHFRNNFQIGTAINAQQLASSDASLQLTQEQFNSITPEYELKLDQIAPSAGVLNFDAADRLVDWAIANNMTVRGHALLWHESTPAYFLQGTRAEIRTRLETYITEVMTHFSGRIQIWDVVNETVSVDIFNGDQGIGPDRRTEWFEAVGNADYIDWAFQAARAADPTAQLFLSDYETENPIKQGYLIEILQRLKDRNIPIDGVGHQFHLNINTPPADVMAAIDAVDNQYMGLVNHVTEMDINCYQDRGICWETGLGCEADIGPVAPASLLAEQAQFLRNIFNGLVQKQTLELVTFWGVRDSDSWLNFTPAERYNYPLLFDREGEPKPCFSAITDPAFVI